MEVDGQTNQEVDVEAGGDGTPQARLPLTEAVKGLHHRRSHRHDLHFRDLHPRNLKTPSIQSYSTFARGYNVGKRSRLALNGRDTRQRFTTFLTDGSVATQPTIVRTSRDALFATRMS
jgi:hypothetical protein